MAEPEHSNRIVELKEGSRKVRLEVRSYAGVRFGIVFAALGLTMILHFDAWITSHAIAGYEQWFYIIPFLLVLALIGACFILDYLRLEKIFK